MTPTLTADWLEDPSLQKLFDVFEKEGACLRLVGGAVRDGLLHLPVNDMDLAVDRDPQAVIALLRHHHLKVIPTGIAYGTITVILENKPYQITSLRVDVETFGRKAQVAFTDDWMQDAARRDFTINALYADRNGKIFDPMGGIEDLTHHRVRFIGESTARIHEDTLRILRFFRFSGRFGREPYDQEGLAACRQYASHLPFLARERVREEFFKILSLLTPLYALQAMEDTGVLAYILPSPCWERLRAMVTLEKSGGFSQIPVLRLAALTPDVEGVASVLRLSSREKTLLSFLLAPHPPLTFTSLKPAAYGCGGEKTFLVSFLQTASQLASCEISREKGVTFLKTLQAFLASWRAPTFPLTGRDVLTQGLPAGVHVGVLLKAVEAWWLAKDLTPNRDACLAYLSTLL